MPTHPPPSLKNQKFQQQPHPHWTKKLASLYLGVINYEPYPKKWQPLTHITQKLVSYALTQNQFDHIHFIDDIIRTFFDIIKNTGTVQIFIFTVCNKILDFLLKKWSFGLYIDCKHWTKRLCCPEIYSGDTIIQKKTNCFPNDLLLVKNWLFWQLLFFFTKNSQSKS